jgi:predicted O-methyltransferase YrrM
MTTSLISIISNNRFYAKLPVWIKRFLQIILVLQDIIHIKVNLRNSKKLDNILKITFNSNFIRPIQIREEIKNLLLILDKVKPKVILEIGTAGGDTLFLFSNVAHEEAILISVDLYQTIEKRILFKYIKKEKQKIFLIQGDSHSIKTLRKIEGILRDDKVDFLFIDGDHSYEGVKKDFEMYSPLVRKGGIIAFHDIIPDYYTRYGIKTGSWAGEVYKFWNEVKERYEHLEIVKDRNQDACGIGVLFVKY